MQQAKMQGTEEEQRAAGKTQGLDVQRTLTVWMGKVLARFVEKECVSKKAKRWTDRKTTKAMQICRT